MKYLALLLLPALALGCRDHKHSSSIVENGTTITLYYSVSVESGLPPLYFLVKCEATPCDLSEADAAEMVAKAWADWRRMRPHITQAELSEFLAAYRFVLVYADACNGEKYWFDGFTAYACMWDAKHRRPVKGKRAVRTLWLMWDELFRCD